VRRLAICLAAGLLIAQAAAPDQPPTSPAPPSAPPPPAWLPRGTAELVVLDKVSARATPLTVKVGETVQVGPLSIGVRSCFVRPPDVPADSTAFLDVTSTTEGASGFHAWMIASAPAVSAMQDPVYDVRLTACR
jgi:hypothetical protein